MLAKAIRAAAARVINSLLPDTSPKQPSRRALAEQLEARLMLSSSPPDSSDMSSIPWTWYHGVDGNFLSARVNEGYRIVDLEVENPNTPTFTAALVQNSGDFAKGWWWYYGQSATDVNNLITANNMRLTHVDPYIVGGQLRFAILGVPNTGADHKVWWWYYGDSTTDISNQITANNARLTDLSAYNGGSTYAVVMISNTGADAKGWWYYYDQTPTQLSNLFTTNNARPVELDPVDSNHFNVIMEQNDGTGWYWWYGGDERTIDRVAAQNGARIFDVEPYQDSGGNTVYASLMVSSPGSIISRVGQILDNASSTANTGMYLKKVDGPVLAQLDEQDQFEPASMIKCMVELTAMRAVQAGTVGLNDPVTWYYKPGDPTNQNVCPDDYAHTAANATTEPMSTVIDRMMKNSDNRATEALVQKFGYAAINATGAFVGMNNSVLSQTLGCGVPGNFLTLYDAGLLYNGVYDGTLLNEPWRGDFFHYMINESQNGIFPAMQTVVNQEAANILGKPTNDPSVMTLTNDFIAQMKGSWKGGGYTLYHSSTQWSETRTVGGYVSLPFLEGQNMVLQSYVYGIFIDGAVVPMNPYPNPQVDAVNNAWSDSQGELLRDEIHAALLTWAAEPGISINNVSATDGSSGLKPFTFTVSLTHPTIDTVTVNFATADGTAHANEDYVPASSFVTFKPLQTTAQITVNVVGGTEGEPNETFFVNLSNPANAALIDNQGLGTILNDDPIISPVVTSAQFMPGSPNTLVYHFNKDVGASLTGGDLVLHNLTTNTNIAGITLGYNNATFVATFNLPAGFPSGSYRATLPGPSVTDAEGNPMLADSVYNFIYAKGGAGDNIFVVKLDPTHTTTTAIDGNLATVLAAQAATLSEIAVEPGSGNDTAQVDFSNGNPIPPPQGIQFDGGAGSNVLDVVNTASSTDMTAYPPAVVLDTLPIRYTNAAVQLDHPGGGAINLHSLSIADGARVGLAAGDATVLDTSFLALAGTGTLDLADEDMIVKNATDAAALSALSSITHSIANARNTSPLWHGNGITSSVAQADPKQLTGLAVSLNRKLDASHNTVPMFAAFDGQPVDMNAALVKYTWNGDMTMDGIVNFDDYFLINTGFLSNGVLTGYHNGDINFDHLINFDDYFLTNSAFLGQNKTLIAASRAPSVFSSAPISESLRPNRGSVIRPASGKRQHKQHHHHGR